MKYLVRVGDQEVDVALDGDIVTVNGISASAHVTDLEGTPVRMVTIADAVHRVELRRGATRGSYTLWLDGFRYEVEALDERTRAIRALSGVHTGPAGPAPLRAPMPGMVVRVTVRAGDTVQAGQALVVMEAMKMENELRALTPASVRAVLVQPGTAVEKGTSLLELE